MSATKSRSAGELASTGLMKRGAPTIPSEIIPPDKGTWVIRDWLSNCNRASELTTRATTSTAKTLCSFREKVTSARLIFSLIDNLPVKLDWLGSLALLEFINKMQQNQYVLPDYYIQKGKQCKKNSAHQR